MTDEVGQDRQIRGEEADANGRDAVKDLENLQRKEGGSDEGGEIFGPNLLQHKAYAFQQAEAGVKKHEDADLAQTVVIEDRDLFQEEGDELAFRISVQSDGKIGENVSEILMDEAQRAYSYGNQQ
jgi:hypothetical protein